MARKAGAAGASTRGRSRRELLAGAAGALGVVGARSLLSAKPAQATQGSAVIAGQLNDATEIVDTAKEGMLTTFKAQPGFIRYGLADTGDASCLSISLWESHAQAEAAAPVAATWVREHLADRIELRSNEVGDLAFFEGVPATG